MQIGVVFGCLLSVSLLGCQVARSVDQDVAPIQAGAEVHEPDTSLRALEPAPAAPPDQAVPAPVERPSLLSLFTLGVAVIGAVATPPGSCGTDECLAASIIDKTAQLEGATRVSLEHARADTSVRSARR